MLCSNGHECEEAQRFCPRCGTPVAGTSQALTGDAGPGDAPGTPDGGRGRSGRTAVIALVISGLVVGMAGVAFYLKRDRPATTSKPGAPVLSGQERAFLVALVAEDAYFKDRSVDGVLRVGRASCGLMGLGQSPTEVMAASDRTTAQMPYASSRHLLHAAGTVLCPEHAQAVNDYMLAVGMVPSPSPTPTDTPEPGSCDAARDPETNGLDPADAAKGLYKAWHDDQRDWADQCASQAAINALFAMPLVTASFVSCSPATGSGVALATDCTFQATEPPGKLVMHEQCDDIDCGVTGVIFKASTTTHVQGCDTRYDSHGRLSSDALASAVYEAWRANDQKALKSCYLDDAALRVLKSHRPVALKMAGCVDTQEQADGSNTRCSFRSSAIANYLVVNAQCGASAGCQFGSLAFDRRAS